MYAFRYIIQEEDVRTIKRYPNVNLRRRWGFWCAVLLNIIDAWNSISCFPPFRK